MLLVSSRDVAKSSARNTILRVGTAGVYGTRRAQEAPHFFAVGTLVSLVM